MRKQRAKLVEVEQKMMELQRMQQDLLQDVFALIRYDIDSYHAGSSKLLMNRG
jgi:hypothetical protein